MAAKAVNVKLEESKILDLKNVASTFHITITDAINDALDAYLRKMKNDPFYRLTANVEMASETETAEILGELESLTDDDLKIVSGKKCSL